MTVGLETPWASNDLIRTNIKTLIREVDRNYVELSRLLYLTRHCETWKEWGHDSFADYVENEAGKSMDQARALISIFERLVIELEVDETTLKLIGWTKARLLLKVVDKQNVNDWLEKAKTLSRRKLQDSIKEARKTDEEKPKRCVLAFYPDQQEIIDLAVKASQEISGSGSKSHNIYLICLEWLATKADGKDREHLVSILQSLQKAYGVDLEIGEPAAV